MITLLRQERMAEVQMLVMMFSCADADDGICAYVEKVAIFMCPSLYITSRHRLWKQPMLLQPEPPLTFNVTIQS